MENYKCNYQNSEEIRWKEWLSNLASSLVQYYKKRKKDFARVCICILLSSCAILLFFTLTKNDATPEYHPVPCYGRHLGNYTIFYPTDWGGKLVDNLLIMPLPVGLVLIGHTETESCDTFSKCATIVRTMQIFQINSMGYKDICFNFLIGGEGNIYVARGWDRRNCYHKLSVGISFIGNFNKERLTEPMKESFGMLLQQGLDLSILATEYIMIGVNQSEYGTSTGKYVYSFIKDLPHFSDIDLNKKLKQQCSIYEVPFGHGLWPRKLIN